MPADQEPTILELGLHRRDPYCYAVELRVRRPEDAIDDVANGELVLDRDQLLQEHLDDEKYGQLLTRSLLADTGIRELLGQARQASQAQNRPISFRLFIGPTASELHTIPWERMKDPTSEGPLVMRSDFRFSRYLTSRDWRPIRIGTRHQLNTLVVIANPGNLLDYSLTAIDREHHLTVARRAFSQAKMTTLVDTGEATLDKIIEKLRAGCDVLYLVCHGRFHPETGHPFLFLEDDKGNVQRIDGTDLARRIEALERRPRLIALISCESATSESPALNFSKSNLGALGPRLAQAGVPAVVAMHGRLSNDAAVKFVPTFFQELFIDGRVDRAMAIARSHLDSSPDWWKPVLFTRLARGQLWYSRGISGKNGEFEKWKSLVTAIKAGECTPIIGPGVAEHLLGGRREIAIRWAQTENFPLSPNYSDDLTQVSQYVAVRQGTFHLRKELENFVSKELLEHYQTELLDLFRKRLGMDNQSESLTEEQLMKAIEESPLAVKIGEIGRHYMQDPSDASRFLAELQLPVYVVANYSNLMEDALILTGKKPRKHFYRWKDEFQDYWPVPVLDGEHHWKPIPQEPLVCHLFGGLERPRTLVLTEDDYFDYLLGLGRDRDEKSMDIWGIPKVVRARFNYSSLLFLGFSMDDWGFRVLFRSIVRKESRELRRDYAHVAVQLDPEEGQTMNPDRAKKYLERYFGTEDIELYWGTTRDFVDELRENL